MAQLLQNAAYGTALILAAALLRRVLKDRLVPEARLALWAVCLFRLLTPAAPESAFSLWGLSRLFAPQEQPAAPTAYVPGVVSVAGTPASAPQPDPGISWETVLFVLWVAVGAALAVRYALAWARTRHAVARAIPVERTDPRCALLPDCARLREGPMEGAPLTFGAIHPTVVLAPGLDGETLECVLAHEGVHASRRDNLWHYIMALALAVYWWNPAVWLMSRLLRRDIELSCDRAAVKKLGAEKRADYANALVSLATQAEGPAFCQTFGRKEAEERILSIMKFKKTSVIGVIFSLALVLALTAAFASEPKKPDEDSTTFSAGSTRAWSMSVDADNALKDFTINLDYLEKELAKHVADGNMSQEEADRVLAQAREAAVDGELKWTFSPDSGLVNDHFDANGDYRPGFNVYYKGPNGNLFPVDPATVVSGFIFPASNGYVEEKEVIELGTLQGEGHIEYDADTHSDDYYTKLPTLDENGNWVAADGAIIGTVNDSVPIPSAAPAKTFNDYTIVGMDENGYPMDEQGNRLVFDDNGDLFMKVRYGYGPCIRTDCTVSGEHYHANGEVIPCPQSNAPTPVVTPEPTTAQPLVTTAPSTSCGVAGCTETRNHQHTDGYCVLLYDPCPVAGCTIPGSHTHNGVNYSCNGFHSGGHCDGNCPTYSTTYPSTNSGHHSESHHGSGHH